jgi:hypothetical protein
MLEYLVEFWHATTWAQVFLGGAILLFSLIVSYAVVTVILIKMPANYFHSDYEHHFLPDTNPVLRMVGLILKNILGVLVIITGIALSFPAVPGPGLVTIFIGLMITDIPGKRKLEAAIIGRPSVLTAINRLRAKYNKPNLVID